MDPNSPWTFLLVIGIVIAFFVGQHYVTRIVTVVLMSTGGRTVCGILLCAGGLIYGLTSNVAATGEYDNHWPVGGGVAAAGVLLLVINAVVMRAEQRDKSLR